MTISAPIWSANWLASRPPAERRRILANLSRDELDLLAADWAFWARPDQLPPPGGWTTWVLLGGRGSGKTRAGAEWLAEEAASGRAGRVALIGDTLHDAREVMIGGESGLRAVGRPRSRPRYEPSRRRLIWPNGAVGHVFSAEDPESLRGGQFAAAWLDEFAKWKKPQETFDMLQMALRSGERPPRQAVTTTPRPVPALKRLLAAKGTVVTRAATHDNAAHLAPGFMDAVVGRYRGTRLGRQELLGELIEENPGALFRHALFDAHRVEAAPPLARVVVAVDPCVTQGASADGCGIVAAGLGEDGKVYVLADRSVYGVSPSSWAARAAETYRLFSADALIAEANQGGDLIAAVIAQVAPDVPLRSVRATRGKRLRAEPVAALYEQGRVRHVGVLPGLEDEMTAFDGETAGGRSPDRLDALVWAIADLVLTPRAAPRLRRL